MTIGTSSGDTSLGSSLVGDGSRTGSLLAFLGDRAPNLMVFGVIWRMSDCGGKIGSSKKFV